MKRLGIDIGSLYLSCVLIEDGNIVRAEYKEHKGDTSSCLKQILALPEFGSYDSAGITGRTLDGKAIVLDPVLAAVEGIRFLMPGCKNAVCIGGESFSVVFFDDDGNYKEHSVNPPCASGTGSFIEQQAERLSLTPAKLAEKACAYSGKTPAIATRCSVFAKTDIIHAMQEGYSLESICAGLCEGIARNILSVLQKGREFASPLGVFGGVSLNEKIIRELSRITGIAVYVPPHAECIGAVGAALLGTEKTLSTDSSGGTAKSMRKRRIPLSLKLTRYPDLNDYLFARAGNVEIMMPKQQVRCTHGSYLGIDIGSTSTKAVIVNSASEIAAGFYTATEGNPIKAVGDLMEAIGSRFDRPETRFAGVATTGSGRKLIRELFNADFEVNEITAHARAAVFLHPEADTIIEIGGQDSKFTRIRNGEVYFSTMNYVCAAGTGSFIEEQAKRLGMRLDEFSDAAFGKEAPYTSDRCTVYMERDIAQLLSEGESREAVAVAVLNSVRDNYLAKVVNKSPIGEYVVFQGATARNKALVASFEALLGKPIHVSPFCHLTGALGAALLCKETLKEKKDGSEFRWDMRRSATREEICTKCANRCMLTVIEQGATVTGWGMKCGKDYAERAPKKAERSIVESRFRNAMAPLYKTKPSGGRSGIRVGIPKALYNTAYGPLWYGFIVRLGFTPVLSSEGRTSLEEGKKIVNSDFCAPMILAHGYMKELLDGGVDFIFSPAVVNERDPDYEGELMFKKKTRDSYFCYYSQYLSSIISKLTALDFEKHLISPLIHFNGTNTEETTDALWEALEKKFPSITKEETAAAFQEAHTAYLEALREWKQKADEDRTGDSCGKLRIALLGRPYVVYDRALNLSIPGKLEEKGAAVFFQEELPIEDFELAYANKYYERMHWHYGKQIVKAAEYAAVTENFYPVFLTCFRCSPDSFLLSYVKDILTYYGKPFLVLQLDEHSSDIGYETRIEAGLRSFENHRRSERTPHRMRTFTRNDSLAAGDTVLIPYLDMLISGFWSACFERAGYRTLLLHPEEQSLNTGYQYANGGECMPLVALMGSAIETVRSESLRPESTFFYMPTLCMACNFPQFPILSDLAFESAGLKGLKIGLINSMSPGDILPQSTAVNILESNIIGGILYKLYYRIKPYETRTGDADLLFKQAGERMRTAIRNGLDLRTTLSDIVSQFAAVERNESGGRKPKIALIGDLYVKFNEIVNQNIQSLIHELGGELIIPSLTEYAFHFYDADVRLHRDDPRHFRLLRTIEKRYEKIAESLMREQAEPDFEECTRLLEEYGIRHYIAGETTINVGRALYFIKHGLADAIIHINPMFCCPGVVTASIFRKMQEDFDVPIIDIFYDGTGSPNRAVIPHIHYLKTRNIRPTL